MAPALDELAAKGITVVRERQCQTHKVVMSVVSGSEELDGPHETVFHRIPIITGYANRHFVDGRWRWCGMVRFSRDPQKLVNYNLTTGQEILGKQQKATPIVTPKMLEGAGVKALWDNANVLDTPYLPITPDPMMPGGPQFLTPPPIHAAYAQMAQLAVDMLKASDGIYDASVGARSNETSGRAIMARQQEGDTATFDYQDALVKGKQSTGEVINHALAAIYDTPRQVRIIGKDGGEDFVTLYDEEIDQQTGQPVKVNDLSQGQVRHHRVRGRELRHAADGVRGRAGAVGAGQSDHRGGRARPDRGRDGLPEGRGGCGAAQAAAAAADPAGVGAEGPVPGRDADAGPDAADAADGRAAHRRADAAVAAGRAEGQ